MWQIHCVTENHLPDGLLFAAAAAVALRSTSTCDSHYFTPRHHPTNPTPPNQCSTSLPDPVPCCSSFMLKLFSCKLTRGPESLREISFSTCCYRCPSSSQHSFAVKKNEVADLPSRTTFCRARPDSFPRHYYIVQPVDLPSPEGSWLRNFPSSS